LFAVFARDPDRTTFEFERNLGEDDPAVVGKFTSDLIGYPQNMDHVGIRTPTPDASFVWYAEKLGFVFKVGKYVPNPEVLKNFAPWISRTPSHCDINLIINGNSPQTENILTAGNILKPGKASRLLIHRSGLNKY
jgi:hypothetical protein